MDFCNTHIGSIHVHTSVSLASPRLPHGRAETADAVLALFPSAVARPSGLTALFFIVTTSARPDLGCRGGLEGCEVR